MAVIPGQNLSAGANLTTYTLAIATTGELTTAAGGPVAAAALVNQYVDAINKIYGQELAIQFQLHPQNSLLMFTNAITDGYTNGDKATMLNENPAIINNTLNGSPTNDNGYDFGHVLGLFNGGGIAGTGQKASGASGMGTPELSAGIVAVLAHEVGHQFSANHTFNGLLSSCNQRSDESAFEPGSGSTLLSYSRLCDADNITYLPNDKTTFHAATFNEIIDYATTIVPDRGTKTPTGNQLPTINAGLDRTIPALTPFTLNATASDPDVADQLTYTWDQIDNGAGIKETLLGTPLTVQGQPAKLTNTLNQLDQTTAPYIVGDKIKITGTDATGRQVQGSYTFAAGDTLAKLLTGQFLDDGIQTSFYNAQNFLTTRVTLTAQGRIQITARNAADMTLTLTLQSDPADATPLSGLTNFGQFTLIADGRADPGGVSLPISNARDNIGPLFRSFAPAPVPTRTFPALADILANTSNTTNVNEHLPSQSRELNFRATVRDNHLFNGKTISSIVSDDVKLTVVNTGAPFRVSSHNAVGQTLLGGSQQTISWDVAGTTANGINVSLVDILISFDGGLTFPLKLASQTANDGSENVTLPNINVAQARFKVQADPAQNIFFDINDANFQINFDVTAPGVIVNETSGNTTVAEGAFTDTGMLPTDIYTIGLSVAPASLVQITVTADAQTQISLDGLTFFPAVTVSFGAGDVAMKMLRVKAVNDSLAEGFHRGTVRHAITSSADPQYSPAKFTADAVTTVKAMIYDDEAPPLVGLDFNLRDGDPSPLNWTATSNPFLADSTNMTREGGATTPFDLTFTATSPGQFTVFTGSTNIDPTTIPRHAPDLSGLDGQGTWDIVSNVTAVWSDLQPNKKYRVYVFAVGEANLNQTVAITGSGVDDPPTFIQNGTGNSDRLFVNGAVGSSSVDVEASAQTVTAAANGKITVRFTPNHGSKVVLAGLAIQEVFEAPPGFTITEIGAGTETTEAGGSDTFTVVLDARPASNVVLNISSANTAEVTVNKATLTFTPQNWNVAQTVTVAGVDDAVVDGDKGVNVSVGIDPMMSDAAYRMLPSKTVSVTNKDNEVAAFIVTETDGKTETTEARTTDTFTVVLAAQPLSSVVFDVVSANTAEATVSNAKLTFTPQNWNTAQTIMVTGVDDLILDGDQTFNITISIDQNATDVLFRSLPAKTVSETNKDDEVVGFTVAETGGNTEVSETRTQDTFTVVLTVQPASNVVFTVASTNTAEATVDPTTVTFTPQNWNVPQTATVSGVDDTRVDGDQQTDVTLSVNVAQSDPAFANLAPKSVRVTTKDNDLAAFSVTETGANTEVTELGGTDTINVVLTAEPIANVVFKITSARTTEAVVDKATITFTPQNWNVSQVVTITGAQDNLIDGNQVVAITVTPDAANSQAQFGVLAPQAVNVTVVDSAITKPWQNPRKNLDVNDDTFIVPQDALFVINELNGPRFAGIGGLLPVVRPADAPFYDVDGDGFVAPLDALLIINHLNANPNPEGESAGPVPSLLPAASVSQEVLGAELLAVLAADVARERTQQRATRDLPKPIAARPSPPVKKEFREQSTSKINGTVENDRNSKPAKGPASTLRDSLRAQDSK